MLTSRTAPNRAPSPMNGVGPLTAAEFESFRSLLLDWTGITLSDNKRELVYSRLTKRLRHLGFDGFSEYYDFLTDPRNHGEKQEFINCMTTNKTEFFREAHHFEFLKSRVFPELRARAKQTGKRRARVWCSAASTGEEPYSLAITLLDGFHADGGWNFDLIASDIDTACLRTAQAGVYDEDRIGPLTPDQKTRHFLKGRGPNAGKVAVKDHLREMIDFRQLNLVQDPLKFDEPFDVIFCRNVMIYFNRETQRVLVEKFANALRPGGYLIIGHSETLHEVSNRFTPLGKTIYRMGEATAEDGPVAPMEAPRFVRTGAPAAAKPDLAMDVSDEKLPNHSIIVGELHASREPVCVSTVLGSCVAACLFDPVKKLGGMNHFLLPDGDSPHSSPDCYGIHAMERLINELLKLGADRSRLKAKIFGGAQLRAMSDLKMNIGRRNIEFVRSFLQTEGIPIVGERVGGDAGVKVCFHTHTARVLVKPVGGAGLKPVLEREAAQGRQAREEVNAPVGNRLTLF